jgi:hypothetical protein
LWILSARWTGSIGPPVTYKLWTICRSHLQKPDSREAGTLHTRLYNTGEMGAEKI